MRNFAELEGAKDPLATAKVLKFLCIHEPDCCEIHLLFQESFIKLFELVPIKEKIDWIVVVDQRTKVLLRRLNVRVNINKP
jgi:hypothetical protein